MPLSAELKQEVDEGMIRFAGRNLDTIDIPAFIEEDMDDAVYTLYIDALNEGKLPDPEELTELLDYIQELVTVFAQENGIPQVVMNEFFHAWDDFLREQAAANLLSLELRRLYLDLPNKVILQHQQAAKEMARQYQNPRMVITEILSIAGFETTFLEIDNFMDHLSPEVVELLKGE